MMALLFFLLSQAVYALGISGEFTPTETAARIAADSAIYQSTAQITGALTSIATSTTTIAQDLAVETGDRLAAEANIGASTAATAGIVSTLGTSTATTAEIVSTLGTSTATTAEIVSTLGTSTATIAASMADASGINAGAIGTSKIDDGAITTPKLGLTPAACSGSQYATGYDSTLALTCGTPAGAGDAVKSANETISGDWTHTGKFEAQNASTFTGTAYFRSTITYTGANNLGLAPGMMVLVSSASFTTVTAATVTLPAPYTIFFITAYFYNADTSSDRTLLARFGGDSTTVYDWENIQTNSGGSSSQGCSAGIDFRMTYTNHVDEGAWASLTATCHILSSNRLHCDSSTVYWNSSGYANKCDGSVIYKGTTQRTMNLFWANTTACDSGMTQIANILTGKIFVFALPF